MCMSACEGVSERELIYEQTVAWNVRDHIERRFNEAGDCYTTTFSLSELSQWIMCIEFYHPRVSLSKVMAGDRSDKRVLSLAKKHAEIKKNKKGEVTSIVFHDDYKLFSFLMSVEMESNMANDYNDSVSQFARFVHFVNNKN